MGAGAMTIATPWRGAARSQTIKIGMPPIPVRAALAQLGNLRRARREDEVDRSTRGRVGRHVRSEMVIRDSRASRGSAHGRARTRKPRWRELSPSDGEHRPGVAVHEVASDLGVLYPYHSRASSMTADPSRHSNGPLRAPGVDVRLSAAAMPRPSQSAKG